LDPNWIVGATNLDEQKTKLVRHCDRAEAESRKMIDYGRVGCWIINPRKLPALPGDWQNLIIS
jgi:hypothetical protein